MKERGGVWGGGRLDIPLPPGPRRMTGSAASTPCGSAAAGSYEVGFSYSFCSKIIFYERKGRGLGRGSVRDWSLAGPRRISRFSFKTNGKRLILLVKGGRSWVRSREPILGPLEAHFGPKIGPILGFILGRSGALLKQIPIQYNMLEDHVT